MNARYQQITAIPMVSAQILMDHSFVHVVMDFMEMEHFVKVMIYYYENFIVVVLALTSRSFFILDINECDQSLHQCHANAYCTNTNGSFTCTCSNGYSGNGTTCEGINFHCHKK